MTRQMTPEQRDQLWKLVPADSPLRAVLANLEAAEAGVAMLREAGNKLKAALYNPIVPDYAFSPIVCRWCLYDLPDASKPNEWEHGLGCPMIDMERALDATADSEGWLKEKS